MSGTRRDAIKLAAEAGRNGWRESPDPDGVTVAEVIAEHRAMVTGDEVGWWVICGCGFRERGTEPAHHIAAALVDAGLTTPYRRHLSNVEAERACVAGREFHDKWIEDLCGLIPEDDIGRLSNPEGAAEAIILDCFRTYVADLAAERAAHEALRERLAALADDLWRATPCDCGHRADMHTMGGWDGSICTGGLACSCTWSFVRIGQHRLRALLDAEAGDGDE